MNKLSWKHLFLPVLALILFFSFTGRDALAEQRLILATTTSTANSGLLDYLLPEFEEKYDVRVDVVAVGTGQAIALGERGDADVILVHARPAEDKFVAEGYGVNRRDVMYNDFVILGPESDPAGITGAKTAVEALTKIAEVEQLFVSRGDDSGTHKKEKSLWKEAGIEPSGSWYLSVGQGMGASLTIADQKQAYIISDWGTWLAMKDKLDLKVLFEGDPELFNPYGIIAVNPDLHPHVNYEKAMALINWITSPEVKEKIKSFTRYGEQLFKVYE
ncbi:MAG: substrate-binding domain-containing protein [Firmicutes bacterium]|nr:substrate-binding domain-containing protein [Bacillota bacterium]